VTAERVFELVRHLTQRDREIALVLYDQQLLTTAQLQLLFFSSRRRAQDRLLFLYRHRVVDRFFPPSPFAAGKPEAHWLLDEAGAILVAAMLGLERKQLGWQRRDDWGSHPQLAHRLEANRFVTDLIAASLHEPTMGVRSWYSSRDAAARLGNQQTGELRPDTGFLLDVPAGAIEYVLEWDRGTETQARLTEKLYGYRLAEGRLRASEPRTVLFVVPGVGRVRTLQRAYDAFKHERERHRRKEGLVNLEGRWPLLAATVADLRRHGTLGRVWQRIEEENEQRFTLAELPVRSDLAQVEIELALGRRWRKDQPRFWQQLSPLHRRGDEERATSDGAVAVSARAVETDPAALKLTEDAQAEDFLERLRQRREAEREELRRDLEAAASRVHSGGRVADLRPSGLDGLMVDPGDELEEEQWR
jgi:Replication-relaxation